MTRNNFDEIQIGTPVAQLKGEVGEPYEIRSLNNGQEEYEYLERVDIGDSTLLMINRYYLIVSNGKVVAKRTQQQRPPAYDLIYDDDPNDLTSD